VDSKGGACCHVLQSVHAPMRTTHCCCPPCSPRSKVCRGRRLDLLLAKLPNRRAPHTNKQQQA
jgi:hypothetical protein